MLVVAVAALVARLYWFGPLAISPFKEDVESALESAAPGIDFGIGAVSVRWHRDDSQFELFLAQVTLVNRMTGERADLPSLGVGLNGEALFAGRIEPSVVAIPSIELSLDWSASVLQARLLDGADEMTDRPEILRLLAAFLDDGPDGMVPRLRAVVVQNANLLLREQDTGVAWKVPNARLRFLRRDSGPISEIEGTLHAAGEQAEFRLNVTQQADESLTVAMDIAGLRPTPLLTNVGIRDLPAAITGALSGNVELRIGADGSIADADFKVQVDGGTLGFGNMFKVPPTLVLIRASGSYVHTSRQLILEEWRLDTGNGVASGVADIRFLDPKPKVRVDGLIDHVSIRHLIQFWPDKLAPNARSWINKNMPGGDIRDGVIHLDLPSERDAGTIPTDEQFRLDFKFNNISAHYLRPMPPIENGSGSARLTASYLDLDVAGGEVAGLQIEDSTTFRITDLSTPGAQRAVADIFATGGLREHVELIAHPPLDLARKYSFDPENFRGTGLTNVRLQLPLAGEITLADVKYEVEALIDEGEIDHIFDDGGLTEGALILNADATEIVAKGAGRLKGTQFDLTWRENLTAGEGEFKSQYDLAGLMTVEDLARFDITTRDLMRGTAYVDVSLFGTGRDITEGTGKARFSGAELTPPVINWRKPWRLPGEATFNLQWSGDQLNIRNIAFEGNGGTVSGWLLVEGSPGAMTGGEINFRGGLNDLTVRLTPAEDHSELWHVEARSLDIRPYLTAFIAGDGITEEEFPYALVMEAKNVRMLNGVEMATLSVDGEKIGSDASRINVSGELGQGASVRFDIWPADEDGRQAVDIVSGDAGRIGLGVGIFANASGGELDIDAGLWGPAAQPTMEGLVRATDLQIVRSSALTEVLEAGGREGIDEFLDDQPIKLSQVRIPFRLSNGIIDVSKGRANGPAIGFTMKGQVSPELGKVNMNGVIVPAYGINALIGKVPLVGPILTGGKGKGLFGVTFRVEGDTNNPQVSVNALSALAPGFLRGIFEGKKGTIDVPDEELANSETQQPLMTPEATPEQ